MAPALLKSAVRQFRVLLWCYGVWRLSVPLRVVRPLPDVECVGSEKTFVESSKLVAPNAGSGDWFGNSVSMSRSGLLAIVGAYGANGAGATDAGAAYVFLSSDTGWEPQTILVASDGAADDYFGWSVSMSDGGQHVIMGAYGADGAGGMNIGAAYVFMSYVSTEQAKLVASDGAADDYFGWSVSMGGNGQYAIVGAYGDDNAGGTDAGAAYVFLRSGSSWTEQTKLVASDGAADDYFGWSVSMSGEGQHAIVGSYGDGSARDTDTGAAYVFQRDNSNSTAVWTEQAKLVASDGAAGGGYFGWSVSISDDGDAAIVGLYSDDIAGAAYIFLRSGTSWTEKAKLSGHSTYDQFGSSVSMSGDGLSAIVGAFASETNRITNAGAAYAYGVYYLCRVSFTRTHFIPPCGRSVFMTTYPLRT